MPLDAHAHIWSVDAPWMGWLRETPDETYRPVMRDFGVADLEATLGGAGMDGVVLVHAATVPDETAWLLWVAEQHEFIAGVVGWVSLVSAAETERQLDALQPSDGLVGIRYMDGWPPEGDVLRTGRAYDSATMLAERNLALDVMVEPDGIKYVTALAERVPDLRIVVDHLARHRPATPFSAWAYEVSSLAPHPNVFVKYSGWSTRLDRVTAGYVKPCIDHVLTTVGASRVLYASNWPICMIPGDYETTYAASCEAIADLSDFEKDAIFSSTAQRVYGIEEVA